MSLKLTALTGPRILDQGQLRENLALLVTDRQVSGIVAAADIPSDADVVELAGGYLVPGFVDLQVNGGGGVMFRDVETLRIMSKAHASIGATSILPTLITDTPENVRLAVDAVEQAIAEGVPGILGLHLEGPHLSLSRKGAHDPSLIRPMTDEDLTVLLDGAARLPVLKVTVAPENVTNDQISALSQAGVLISLGHTDADFATCQGAADAGARCVTHLFNAQSQIGNREPGTVGAALALGSLSAGLIADGIHVHPESMGLALRSNCGPGQIFLVSDAMATAASEIDGFTLNDRWIQRSGNRLTLKDGTLAGAHLEVATAVRNVVEMCDVPLATAFAMASETPAALIGASHVGSFTKGAQADILHLTEGLELAQVWQQGRLP